MPQHRNRLAAHGKWPPSGLWQSSCVYFVTAWSVCSFWHHRRHPNQKVTYHLWLFWNGSRLVHLLPKFLHSVCFCWSRINSIHFEMWCATRFSSGTFLFTLYTQSLSTVICQSGHSYHFFADDSQPHNSRTPSDFPALVHSLKDCIEDDAQWMCDSMLKMNHDKTELTAGGT